MNSERPQTDPVAQRLFDPAPCEGSLRGFVDVQSGTSRQSLQKPHSGVHFKESLCYRRPSQYAINFWRTSGSSAGPSPAPQFSSMCAGLPVPGMTQVTAS